VGEGVYQAASDGLTVSNPEQAVAGHSDLPAKGNFGMIPPQR
jgi:hypothetical protein